MWCVYRKEPRWSGVFFEKSFETEAEAQEYVYEMEGEEWAADKPEDEMYQYYYVKE